MKDYWEIEWTVNYGGRLYLWRQLTPTARLRLRRLVGRGKSSGRLSAADFR